MDRINHVKIVSPDPDAIDHFLTEVLDLPEGWSLGATRGERDVRSPARNSDGEFTVGAVHDFRGSRGIAGRITGSTESRQFQLLQGDSPHIWAVAIGTRHLERAHENCVEQGIPCTELLVTGWGEGVIQYFYAEAGGIVFEVMRAEAPPRTV